ncbi:AHH domain-containing protein [Microcoleus sp. T3_D1]|uniref:AHH domain-containing protein n=1 Tax=Microcoleus sp. T3_D1 TaxID=3055427 RepID=UPI002FD70EEE
MINRPPADGFPPSPEPFPMPNPEKPEPLITRVPLLGLKEYLDNYVFESSSSNAAKLRKNMQAAGEVFNPGDEAHHLVPSGDPLARAARQILKSYGIDINSALNGVRLTEDEHRKSGLHTDRAILEVAGRIVLLDSKAEVEAELRAIKAEILAKTFP